MNVAKYTLDQLFPPCMGGCIEHYIRWICNNVGFLPVWEGVSYLPISNTA